MNSRITTPVAYLILTLLVAGTASGTGLTKAEAFWAKSFLAKGDEPKACFYATVTAAAKNMDGQPEIYLAKITDKGFNRAKFTMEYKNLGAVGFAGDVLEACVVPGDYIIFGMMRSWGVYGQGAYSASSTLHEDYAFHVDPGVSYYLGNITITNDISVHNLIDRDKEIIAKFAKSPPRSDLVPVTFYYHKWVKQ